MEIHELQLSERHEDLSDVVGRQLKVQASHVEPMVRDLGVGVSISVELRRRRTSHSHSAERREGPRSVGVVRVGVVVGEARSWMWRG